MKSIPIIFQAGSYGMYLIWLMNTMFTDLSVYEPFNLDKGNSHNVKKHLKLDTIYDIDAWLANPTEVTDKLCFKVHPKTSASHSMVDNTNQLTTYFGKSILVYPSKTTYLLHSNNYVSKVWDNFWEGPLGYINQDNLYDNFPVDRNTPLVDVPKWIIREWLSYNFFSAMDAQIEWYFPDQFSNQNCLIIFIDELLYQPELTLVKIQNFFALPFTKNFYDLLPIHKKNMSAQKHLTQDNLAYRIVSAVSNGDTSVSWNNDDLTLITESWIHRWIRKNNYDFKCHNLNNFPTSSKQLIQLL